MSDPEEALLAYQLSLSRDLTIDFTRSLPGDQLDDSTYSEIEDALDRIEAPMTLGSRWLTLVERIDALRLELAKSSPPAAHSGEAR